MEMVAPHSVLALPSGDSALIVLVCDLKSLISSLVQQVHWLPTLYKHSAWHLPSENLQSHLLSSVYNI